MNWDDLRIFLALARRKSVRAASESLDVSYSQIARRIHRLEIALGRRLFDRSAFGSTLTKDGQEIFNKARGIEERILGLQQLVGSKRIDHSLTDRKKRTPQIGSA